MKSFYNRLLSQIGLSLSVLCGLHCIATPLILATAPTAAEWFSEEIEIAVLLASLVIGMWVLWKDMQLHRNILPLLLLLVGFSVLICNHYLWQVSLINVVSFIDMAMAYLWNWYKLKRFKACACVVKPTQKLENVV